jgi:hypothetical protein
VQRQKSPDEPGTDLGFQVWDVDKRRQASTNRPAEKQEQRRDEATAPPKQ